MLNSIFGGLQRCRWQYGCIFIRLAVVASHICEVPRNPPKIRTYSSSTSSKVIDLGVSRKLISNFLLVINSVGIDLKELGGGSAAEMFEILPRDWNLKPIFTHKWTSVVMNWVPPIPIPTIPTLVINSNYGHISYRHRDIDAFSSQMACFPPLPCLTPPSGGASFDVNVI